jgi:hypothetical protein
MLDVVTSRHSRQQSTASLRGSLPAMGLGHIGRAIIPTLAVTLLTAEADGLTLTSADETLPINTDNSPTRARSDKAIARANVGGSEMLPGHGTRPAVCLSYILNLRFGCSSRHEVLRVLRQRHAEIPVVNAPQRPPGFGPRRCLVVQEALKKLSWCDHVAEGCGFGASGDRLRYESWENGSAAKSLKHSVVGIFCMLFPIQCLQF